MENPFPGMNPYLEHPDQWSGFHLLLISALQRTLAGELSPGFVAKAETRTYFDEPESVPIEEIEEPFLTVVDRREGNRRVVAVLELLSPANKEERHDGRRVYLRKQQEIRAGGITLLEIDLLRGGSHTVAVPREVATRYGSWDYMVCLSDAARLREWLFWRVSLMEPLPSLLLPLTPDVAPVRLNLQDVFNRCYQESHLGDDLNYAADPVPPLPAEEAVWMDSLLREKGYR
jgi:hypothetical protein